MSTARLLALFATAALVGGCGDPVRPGPQDDSVLVISSPAEGAVVSGGAHDVVLVVDVSGAGGPFDRAGQIQRARVLVENHVGADDLKFWVLPVGGELTESLPAEPLASVAAGEAVLGALAHLMGPQSRREALPVIVMVDEGASGVPAALAARARAAGAEVISMDVAGLMLNDDPLHVAVQDAGGVGLTEVRFVALDAAGGLAHESSVSPPELQASIALPSAGESRTLEILATGTTSGGKSYSASRTVRVLAQDRRPIVTDVTPAQAAPGDTVTVRGRFFSAQPGGNRVRLGGALVEVADDKQNKAALEFVVPEGAADGTLVVEAEGISTAGVTFRIDRDRDGLPDRDELEAGTDPEASDTDGDGVADGDDFCPLTAPDRDGELRVDELGCSACANGVLDDGGDGGETDVDCGGLCQVCDAGAACTIDDDCGSGRCHEGACLPGHCNTGELDGDEVDVDCAGSCAPCAEGASCGDDADCASEDCTGGICLPAACSNRQIDPGEGDIDCGGPCVKCAAGRSCNGPDDCDSEVCNGGECVQAGCEDGAINGLETDVDCGGGVCDACVDGGRCVLGSDCASGVCRAGVCSAPSCFDAIQNGRETDVDCGGPGCGSCRTGQACGVDRDCFSEICDEGVCTPPTCRNAELDEGEADVDCGGDCAPCAPGRNCEVAVDCASAVCADGSCAAPTCEDGVLNGDERGVDCAGGDCALCADGLGCEEGGDCLSGQCGERGCVPAGCVDEIKGGAESDVDCGGDCDLCGIHQACNVNGDCVSGACQRGLCVDPSCVDEVEAAPETDLDCGGRCAPCRPGQRCGVGGDCDSRVCEAGICAPATCDDNVANGRETDVDCGGDECDPCEVGRLCDRPGDCAEGVCLVVDGGAAECAEPSCRDAVRNGDEPDVDCGGGCDLCPEGGGCAVDEDCVTTVCTAGVCVLPPCVDGVLGGDETDVDCGGPDCAPCESNLGCEQGEDCMSGVCIDDRCAGPRCGDGVRNGGETGRDCGGPCAPCVAGLGCVEGADCETGVCRDDVCQLARCIDGVLNGAETGVDCGGGCPGCAAGVACGEDDDCALRDCFDGACRIPTCEDDRVNGNETDVDCGGVACDPCFVDQACEDGRDCADGVCQGRLCASPACNDGVKNGLEGDVDCGGFACEPCGVDQGCNVGDDCASRVCVRDRDGGVCVAPTCEDRVRNAGETDVDCGGGVCELCRDGRLCDAGGDCVSGVCLVDGLGGDACAPPACDDGVLNGLETDQDCGGPGCEPCEAGGDCVRAGDCDSGVCDQGACLQAACDDRLTNGLETDVDCGGADCAACEDGRACGLGADCDSGICEEGVCLPPECRVAPDCDSGVCVDNACADPACDDGVINGAESDIDCGGRQCDRCALGEGCAGHGDCETDLCRDGECVVNTCFDGELTGDETDVDCGGSCAPCDVDAACEGGTDCATGFCDALVCAVAPTCRALAEGDPSLTSGAYPIGAGADVVWCDLVTDGGGWTLVAATLGEPLDDAGGAWHDGLTGLHPEAAATTLWGGMSDAVGELRHDVRFTCKKDAASPDMDVDLSFYDVDWYPGLVGPDGAGTDADSCFYVDGTGRLPARRDNRSGRVKAAGEPWSGGGAFTGESECDDLGDFAIDFEDAGLDGEERDGTDWGEDDGLAKCGDAYTAEGEGAWFVWVREVRPDCDDGARGPGETGVDCGGGCQPCLADQGCEDDADCVSLVCGGGVCHAPACDDGVINGAETDTDCGGDCPGCDAGGACLIAGDCADDVCVDEVCVDAGCVDGVINGTESDVDCGGDECDPCEVGGLCAANGDCASDACVAGLCRPAECVDGEISGDETDVDCGGGCLPCVGGQGCVEGADCRSTQCDEGACRTAPSCQDFLRFDPAAASGAYPLLVPGADAEVDVRCDMATDEGGWTLVAASRGAPLSDEAGRWHAGLAEATPATAHRAVWDGLRATAGARADLRFTCKADPTADRPDVDLSFYGVPWYDTITTGADVDSCFEDGEDPALKSVPPRRRDNIAGVELPRGDGWNAGFLEGEDSCGDTGDFAVDFDDRGMNGALGDPTDWGAADGFGRCGAASPQGGVWSIWVREARPDCLDGELGGDETDVDCGGSCGTCDEGAACLVDADCTVGGCVEGACFLDPCLDGVQNNAETGVDCGGGCAGCPDGGDCGVGEDCASGVCADAVCAEPTCEDGVANGLETDVDCGGACDPCGDGLGCAVAADCTSLVCAEDVCAAPACDDGVRNGAETDVDCGGDGGCDPCEDGRSCLLGTDCVSTACEDGACVLPRCANGLLDGEESGVDCGGDCEPCPLGGPCRVATDCVTSFCDEEVCDRAESCFELAGQDGDLPGGDYEVAPAGEPVQATCDMVADDGGWTLVSRSAGAPPADAAAAEIGAGGVWDVMRPLTVGRRSDLRFTCRADADGDAPDVDLTFYTVDWYDLITAGTEADSCFNVRDDESRELPARRNNLDDEVHARGTPWAAGFMTGELACDDPDNFTVDFSEAGMDGEERDGTDWGMDDGFHKCGDAYVEPGEGVWSIWVRERRADCEDGLDSPDETDVDCGDLCGPCEAGLRCVVADDCASLNCTDGTCAAAACDDGVRNPGETDIDCGGEVCGGCGDGGACLVDSDCGSGVCRDAICQVPACDDGVANGDETDVDCGGDDCAGCVGVARCEVNSDCASEVCDAGLCRPVHCDSGELDGDETDVDCGGSCDSCSGGLACALGADCRSRVCDAGLCVVGRTCRELTQRDPDLPSGIYPIRPAGALGEVDVWCDNVTDEGGWTLVASAAGAPLADQAAAGHHGNLATVTPVADPTDIGVWAGLRETLTVDGGGIAAADVRFTCKHDPADEAMAVDLSFYAVGWYAEFTAGADVDSCFEESNGAGYTQPAPARRDNVSGDTRDEGDDWTAGYLEGEDSCEDAGDFTVDFDDQGMDGDPFDGTDWGSADGFAKCGDRYVDAGQGAWFLWVRERPAP